jgi:uncharacterized protein (DUF1501 family)
MWRIPQAMRLGGAVKGGDVYGTFPFPALGGPDDANTREVLIPTTSSDQYAGTLATVFPNLATFATTDIGFMG